MAKTFVFVNQKGGVGKTTSAINIGAYIALAGKKVLLVDFDSQGNMSSGVGVSLDKPTVYELIAGDVEAEKAVKHTMIKSLDVISASLDLSGAAIELVEQERREYFLKEALEPLKSKYDALFCKNAGPYALGHAKTKPTEWYIAPKNRGLLKKSHFILSQIAITNCAEVQL